VKARLAEKDEENEEIEVFHLHIDSPELNPNQMVNPDLKQAATKLAPARTKLPLGKATARHPSSVQRRNQELLPTGAESACGLSSTRQCRVNCDIEPHIPSPAANAHWAHYGPRRTGIAQCFKTRISACTQAALSGILDAT
jgi:hypothetical protein